MAKKRGEDLSGQERTKAKPGMPGSVNDERRCHATAHRTGERCRAPAIKGGSVCRIHGGAAKQVKQKAQERLDAAADKLMAELLRIAMDPEEPVYVRLQAIRDALDRAGLGAKHARPLGVEADDPFALMIGAVLELDRSGVRKVEAPDDTTRYALSELAKDETAKNWANLDAEDEAERDQSRIRGDGHVVVNGEVVEPPPNTDSRWKSGWEPLRDPDHG